MPEFIRTIFLVKYSEIEIDTLFLSLVF